MMHNNDANKRKTEIIKNIQTLRFFAAAWVFLFHLQATSLYHSSFSLLNSFASMGFVGVDIFFVISGYVMALTIRNKDPGLKSASLFFLNRFARIYGGWWPYFFAYLLLYIFLDKLAAEHDLLGSFFLIPLQLQKYLVPVTWTLSFELYFYLILSLILIFTKKYIPHILLLLAFITICLTYSFYLNGLYTPDGILGATKFQTFYGYIIIIEFVFGYLLGYTLKLHRNYMIIPAFVLLISYEYHNSGWLYPSGLAGFYHAPERVLYVGAASVCLVFVLSQFSRMGYSPFVFLQKLGNSSYGLYLGHILILAFLGHLIDTQMSNLVFIKTPFFTVLVVIVIVAITRLISSYVESPLEIFLRRVIANAFKYHIR
jgi:exopolysaccharide production protein ExoZ